MEIMTRNSQRDREICLEAELGVEPEQLLKDQAA